MKKNILIGCGILVLSALIWVGARNLYAAAETEESSDTVESAEVESDAAKSADEAEKLDDPEAPASDTAPEETSEDAETAEDESEAVESEEAAENADAAEQEESVEDESTPEETAVSSEEGVLYVMKTSAGNNLGMVPVVNGTAVVMMNGSYASIYQGNYEPEEIDAFSLKMENETAKAMSNSKIAEWAFYREEMLQDYTFPDGVNTIEKFAFARSGLSSISIPEGVTYIGYGAFYHCDALNDVVIPDSVTTIEENAFSHTPWLKNWMEGAAEDDETAGVSDADDFLIVGDGILLAYRGDEEDPVLPETVKSVVPGALGR